MEVGRSQLKFLLCLVKSGFFCGSLADIAFIYFSFNILKTMKIENSISAQDMCSSPAASAQFEFAKS